MRPRLDGAPEGLIAALCADDGNIQLLQVIDRAGKLVVVFLRKSSVYDVQTEGNESDLKSKQ